MGAGHPLPTLTTDTTTSTDRVNNTAGATDLPSRGRLGPAVSGGRPSLDVVPANKDVPTMHDSHTTTERIETETETTTDTAADTEGRR